jgi:hypothetical protein
MQDSTMMPIYWIENSDIMHTTPPSCFKIVCPKLGYIRIVVGFASQHINLAMLTEMKPDPWIELSASCDHYSYSFFSRSFNLPPPVVTGWGFTRIGNHDSPKIISERSGRLRHWTSPARRSRYGAAPSRQGIKPGTRRMPLNQSLPKWARGPLFIYHRAGRTPNPNKLIDNRID